MSFGEKILDYKEDILKDLDELLKIQSDFRQKVRKMRLRH